MHAGEAQLLVQHRESGRNREGTTTHPGLPASQVGCGSCPVWHKVCQLFKQTGSASPQCKREAVYCRCQPSSKQLHSGH